MLHYPKLTFATTVDYDSTVGGILSKNSDHSRKSILLNDYMTMAGLKLSRRPSSSIGGKELYMWLEIIARQFAAGVWKGDFEVSKVDTTPTLNLARLRRGDDQPTITEKGLTLEARQPMSVGEIPSTSDYQVCSDCA